MTVAQRQVHSRRAGSGSAVVLVRAAPYSSAAPAELISVLAARRAVIALDLPGCRARDPLRDRPPRRRGDDRSCRLRGPDPAVHGRPQWASAAGSRPSRLRRATARKAATSCASATAANALASLCGARTATSGLMCEFAVEALRLDPKFPPSRVSTRPREGLDESRGSSAPRASLLSRVGSSDAGA